MLFQELAGSPQRSFYLWKQEPAAPQFSSPHYHGSDPTSPVHAGHSSYAQQVGFYLQQPHVEYPAPTLQSGGPRTTPSGYPGGPMVPSDHVSPKSSRRGGHFPGGPQQQHVSSPYSSDSNRTNSQGPGGQQPMTFTRALEVSDSIQMRQGRGPQEDGQDQQGRDSVYDMNYEISV